MGDPSLAVHLCKPAGIHSSNIDWREALCASVNTEGPQDVSFWFTY